jgi:hypothetical protein
LFGPPEKVAFSAIQKAVRDTLPEPPSGAGPYELSAPGKLEGLFTKAGLNVLKSGEVDCPFSILILRRIGKPNFLLAHYRTHYGLSVKNS